jgi:hypothetical protein
VVLLAFVAVIAVPAVMALGGRNDVPPPLTSPQKVFCGDYAQREGVVEAGIALGSLIPGSSATAPENRERSFSSYQDWQAADSRAFTDACRNAIAALQLERGSAPGDGLLPFGPLIGVVIGALLTILSSEWRAGRDRLRARADALRAAIVAFDSALREYISEWKVQTVKPPSTDDIHEKSATLAALLGQGLRNTDSELGRRARDGLAALTDELGPNNWPAPGADRDRFAEQARKRLQELVRQLYEFSGQYEQWHPKRTGAAETTPAASTP